MTNSLKLDDIVRLHLRAMNNLFMIENGQADIFDFIVIVKSWANSLSSVDGDDVGQSAEGKFDTYLENMIDAEKSKTV